jgi:hypothetical protein
MHDPSLPVTSHALQFPVHALPQQYPSTQKPDVHWLAVVQPEPFGFFARHLLLVRSQ